MKTLISGNEKLNSSPTDGHQKKEACYSLQLCPTLSSPTDHSLSGSSVTGILQAKILEWVAMPFSRGSSLPWERTQVCCMQADSLLSEPTGKPLFVLPGGYQAEMVNHGGWDSERPKQSIHFPACDSMSHGPQTYPRSHPWNL